MNEIKIAIVGNGRRARGITQNVIMKIKEYKVVALCDKYESHMDECIRQAELDDDVSKYTDYETMLEKEELDAVFIATAPVYQAGLSCKALYAGKHVISEVPLSYTLRDCWDLVLAVEKTGFKFAMAEQLRYSRYARECREMNENGDLGKILYVEGQYIHDKGNERVYWDTKEGAHLTLDEGKDNPNAVFSNRSSVHPITYCPHELSPILKILDDRVKTVSCTATREDSYIWEIKKSDTEIGIMHTEKDTLIRIHNSFSVPDPKVRQHWYQIFGTKGQIEMPRAKWDNGKKWFSNSEKDDYEPIEYDMWKPEGMTKTASKTAHFGLDYYPFKSFAKSLTEDKPVEMNVYLAAEACAPGIVGGISAEYDGLPFAVPDFRPGENRKYGEVPETHKAKSLYGNIERDGYIRTPDGRRVEK